MANSRTIEFKGHFDGKQVLDELKKIPAAMKNQPGPGNFVERFIPKSSIYITEHCCPVKVPDDYYKV